MPENPYQPPKEVNGVARPRRQLSNEWIAGAVWWLIVLSLALFPAFLIACYLAPTIFEYLWYMVMPLPPT
jgi:hypothetical protein